jgi:site-specific DNA recombinase
MELKPAVIVARVSTDEQAATGYSLPTQLAAMRAYAAKIGRPVLEEISDDCSGAIPIIKRPGGARLYALANGGKIGAVIFYTQDRIARDENVTEYVLFKAYLHDRGIELHYADKGLDPYTMSDNLRGYVEAYASSGERLKTAERCTRGRHAKANARHWVGAGYTAYGYKREGQRQTTKLVIDELEAAIVRKIYTRFVIGDETGTALSLRGIAMRLQAEGVATPNHRNMTGWHWRPATVRGILTNDLYTGRVYYGRSKVVKAGDKKKREQMPREAWTLAVDAPELAIVDDGIFAAAQKRLQINQKIATRNAKHQYLLTGFFRCGACGGAMAGRTIRAKENGKGYESTHYFCARSNHVEATPCSNRYKTLSCQKVDTLVWDKVRDALTPEKLEKGLTAWRESDGTRLAQVRAIVANIENQEAQAERKIKRLAAAIADTEDETAAQALKVELNHVSKQRAGLAEEKQNRQAELSAEELTPEREAMIRAAGAAVNARMADADFAQKRELFGLLNLKAVFVVEGDERRIDVHCELGNMCTILSKG